MINEEIRNQIHEALVEILEAVIGFSEKIKKVLEDSRKR